MALPTTPLEAGRNGLKDWTDSERERQSAVLSGKTVVANMHKGTDEALIAWAKQHKLAKRIDRRTVWGNPFLLGKHGDRDGIIAAYREHLDHSPGLKANLGKLRGKVLLCWCHPEPCHGDVLCEAVEKAFPTSSPA